MNDDVRVCISWEGVGIILFVWEEKSRPFALARRWVGGCLWSQDSCTRAITHSGLYISVAF